MGRWISERNARFGCSERREGRAENNCSAQSAIFVLVNIFYHLAQLFGGSVAPRRAMSDRLSPRSTQEENAKTLKLFPRSMMLAPYPMLANKVKVLLRALMPCRSMLLEAGS